MTSNFEDFFYSLRARGSVPFFMAGEWYSFCYYK